MILYCIIFISWLVGLFLIGSLVSFLILNSRFNPNPYELILRNTFVNEYVLSSIHIKDVLQFSLQTSLSQVN